MRRAGPGMVLLGVVETLRGGSSGGGLQVSGVTLLKGILAPQPVSLPLIFYFLFQG